jgi:hypothetical protein
MPDPIRTPVTLPGFPFFSQNDNGPDGWRQCQTSALAMCLAYLKVPGVRGDLDYLAIVERYGDTTRQDAHWQALKSLRIRATFRDNLTREEVAGFLLRGRPVAAGLLHRGPVTAPGGGGHWVAVFGQTATAYRVMDPMGEMDLIGGGFVRTGGTTGRNQLYSFKNTGPRWFVEGPATGWGWVFP